jgi:hypothetical protein
MKQQNNSTNKKTLNSIIKCMKKARISQNKERPIDLLEQAIFHHVFLFYIGYVIFFLIMSSLTVYIVGLIDNETIALYIRTVVFLVMIIPLFYATIKAVMSIAKLEKQLDYDNLWDEILKLYLKDVGTDRTEARNKLKKALGHYSRSGEPFKFFIEVFIGGVFIGCLSNRDFQVALLSLSVSKIIDTNPFGATCLILCPLILGIYLFKYYLPRKWIQQVIDQIELAE